MPTNGHAAPRVLPPVAELRVLAESHTHKEIAAMYGVRREAVTMKLKRGDPERVVVRHAALLPWRVRQEHVMSYAARMLRVEGRVRSGMPLPAREASRHASWRERMRADDTVVMYLPIHPVPGCTCGGLGGFHYVKRADALHKYGEPHTGFDSELIFVTRRQGQEILGRAA
jgi:hypothetical protein